ncbi:hypothetical protein EDC04DRAFT_2902189 [Pisolithus marmoratus]|nr:hypothetical protein EDC04DRAFT_2902189 [Pisolithus marmoratus]
MSATNNSTGASYVYDSDKGLPGWAMALAVIGILVAVVFLVFLVRWLLGGCTCFQQSSSNTTDTVSSIEMSEYLRSRQFIQLPPPVYSLNSPHPPPPYSAPTSIDPIPHNQAS